MHILLGHRDEAYCHGLTLLLRGMGHEVAVVRDGESALGALALREVDAVLLEEGLPGRPGAEVLRRLRTSGGKARAVLTRDQDGPPDESWSALEVDVVAGLRALPWGVCGLLTGVEPGPTPESRRSVRKVAEIWARRRDGVLQVELVRDTRWVLVGGGAPVEPRDLNAILAAIAGARHSFEPRDVEGAGDHGALGRALLGVVRPWDPGLGIEPWRHQVLQRTALSEAASALPLDEPVRRLLAALDPFLALSDLLASAGIPEEQVAGDIHALLCLGLLAVDENPSVHEVTHSRPALGTPPPQATARAVPRVVPQVARPAMAAQPPARRPPEPRSVTEDSHGAEPDDVRTDSGATYNPDEAATVASHLSALEQAAQRADRKRKQLLQVFQQSTRPTFSVEETTLLRRLRREAQVLGSSDPWTVLGVPRTSSVQTAQRVGERMLEQYRGLQNHAHAEIRQLAQNISTRVEAALADLVESARGAEGIPGFQEGVNLAQRAQWTQADRYFSALHQRHLDSAPVLAWLGWCRHMNPMRPPRERRQEAREYLLLALQFEPNNADAHHHLARILFEDGEFPAADRHVQAALRTNPDLVGARNLAQKLRARKS